MNMTKRVFSIIMVLITLVSVMSISAEAASAYVGKLNLGYMAPTNSKGTKTIETVKLYGDYDYINFYINSKKKNSYFAYEICSDKEYTKVIGGNILSCDKGTYTFTDKIKLKGNFKSKTYYMVTYAFKTYSDGSIQIDQNSLCEFKVVVKRTADFDDKVVVLKETKNTTKGAYIKWGKLSGANKYYIYRRGITSTKWKKVGSVSSKKTSFTDTSVKSKNGNYIYTVKAINKKGTASRYLYSGLTCLFAKAPALKSVKVTYNNAIEIEWENISSNAKYIIMRKTGDGKWQTVRRNYTKTTYKDTSVKNGKKYTYTVKAVLSTDYGKTSSSYFANEGKHITFLKAPKLNAVDVFETGLRVSWQAVAGASGYEVFRRPYDKSEKWVKLGSVDFATLEFIDSTANSEKSYLYTVKTIGEKGEGSYSNDGVEYIKVGIPSGLKIYETGYTFKEKCLSWNSVKGASKYEVYRKINSGEWELFVEQEGNSTGTRLYYFDDVGTYQFKVRALGGIGNVGEFSEPVSMEYYPEFYIEPIVADKQISLSWSNHKADSYNLYRKEAGQDDSQYFLLTNTTENVYVDTEVENDVLYEYQVRAIVEGKEQTLNLTSDSIGISTTLTGSPEIYTKENRIYFSGMSQVFGYNYETGEWEHFSDNTKKSHAAYCKDGKYRYSFVFVGENGMRSIRENYIVDHEWYATTVDFTSELTADGMKVTIHNPSPEIVEYYIHVGATSHTIKTNGSSSYTHTFTSHYAGNFDNGCPVQTITAITANGDESTTTKEFWYLETPDIDSISRTSKGYVKLTIEQYKRENSGWDGLYIYRKASGEKKYKKIDVVENATNKEGYVYTTYTDKTAKKGVKYTYLVKCYKEYKGETFISYYDKRTIS